MDNELHVYVDVQSLSTRSSIRASHLCWGKSSARHDYEFVIIRNPTNINAGAIAMALLVRFQGTRRVAVDYTLA